MSKRIFVFVVLLIVLFVFDATKWIISDVMAKCDANCIKIKDSYSIWSPKTMKTLIKNAAIDKYGFDNAPDLLNRNYISMYIEWWMHNVGYYITKPFCFNDAIYKINLRFKDVDLVELI